MRLQKYLALCGVGSRRACEGVIAEGRVLVNGTQVTRQGVCVDPRTDLVELDGCRLRPESFVYVVLYKPRGVLCTCHDPQGRAIVTDLVPLGGERIFPVGRLDFDSEGMVVLTNDGEFAHLLAHPRHHVEKTYEVWVAHALDRSQEAQLRKGLDLEGEWLSVSDLVRIGRDGTQMHYRVVLKEGRKRQIRRLFDAMGVDVKRLLRTTIGDLKMTGLRSGEWRHLTKADMRRMLGERADQLPWLGSEGHVVHVGQDAGRAET